MNTRLNIPIFMVFSLFKLAILENDSKMYKIGWFYLIFPISEQEILIEQLRNASNDFYRHDYLEKHCHSLQKKNPDVNIEVCNFE